MVSELESLEEKVYGIAGDLVAEKKSHSGTQHRLTDALAKVNEITSAITDMAVEANTDMAAEIEETSEEVAVDTFKRYYQQQDSFDMIML